MKTVKGMPKKNLIREMPEKMHQENHQKMPEKKHREILKKNLMIIPVPRQQAMPPIQQ